MSALIPALLGAAENFILPTLGSIAQSFLTEGLPNLLRERAGYPSHIERNSLGMSRVPIRAQATDHHHPVFHNPSQPISHVYNNESAGHIVSPVSYSKASIPQVPVETNHAGLAGGTRYTAVNREIVHHYGRKAKHHNVHNLPLKKKKKKPVYGKKKKVLYPAYDQINQDYLA